MYGKWGGIYTCRSGVRSVLMHTRSHNNARGQCHDNVLFFTRAIPLNLDRIYIIPSNLLWSLFAPLQILVFLVYLYNIFKLLLSLRQYSTWDQFLGFSRYFRFLIDVSGYFKSLVDVSRYFKFLMNTSGYLISVEFGRIIRSMEFSKFLRYRVDISRNSRLVDLSRFPRF